MDHFPVPESCKSRIREVPYLGLAPKYDREGFDGFPERCGINVCDIPGLSAMSLSDTPHCESSNSTHSKYIVSFLQEWLWFGMLHEFEKECGLRMDASEFIRPRKAGSSRVLSTEPLLPYVRAASIARLEEYGVPPHLKAGDWVYDRLASDRKPFQVKEVLGPLKYKFEQVEYEKVPAADLIRVRAAGEVAQQELDTSQIDLHIVPLVTLRKQLHLVEARVQARVTGDSPMTRCLRTVMEFVSLADFDVMLSVRILCSAIMYGLVSIFPNKINFIPSRIKIVEFDTRLTCLKKKMIEANWCPTRIDWLKYMTLEMGCVASLLPSFEKVSHRGCSTTQCSFRPTSLAQMQPKHKIESCNGMCDSVSFDEVSLVNVIRSGGIPGVEQRQTEQGMSYNIVDATGREYVAISHVWSHELGNPASNALPMCRMLHLFELIRAISSPHALLWIDTITVPISPGPKLMAMRKLRDVFSQARKVLVIDAHLLQVGSHWLERRIQLRSSEWMRRLWTLQEGRLASQLYIQFQSGAVSIDEVLKTQAEDIMHDNAAFTYLDWETTHILGPCFSQLKVQDIRRRFVDIVEDLAVRNATIATDEPIWIATMLGLELEKFENPPTMVDIYRAMPFLPADLLFVNGPRLDMKGFRWAPSTFMNGDIQNRLAPHRSAILKDMGFGILTNCIFLDESFQLDVGMTACPRFEVRGVGVDDFLVLTLPKHDMKCREERSNLAIVLQASGSGIKDWNWAVLVSEFKKLDRVYLCRYEQQAYVRRKTSLEPEEIAKYERLYPDHFVLGGSYLEQVMICVS